MTDRIARRAHCTLLSFLLFGVLCLGGERSAGAHPADEIIERDIVTVRPDGISVDLTISAGSITFLTIWADADTNADQTLDSAEREAFGRKLADGIAMQLDGTRSALEYVDGSLQIAGTRRDFALESADAAGATVRVTFRASFVDGVPNEVALTITHFAASPYRRAPEIIPMATAPFGVIVQGGGDVNLRLTVTSGGHVDVLPSDRPPVNPNRRTVTTLQRFFLATGIGPGFFLAGILVALLLGAIHALAPGHGKTMVAAYLLGTDGRPRDALALGGIVTLTHTGSVLALGLLTLIAARTWTPERILLWLEAVSSSALVIAGVACTRSRVREARSPRRWAREMPFRSHGTASDAGGSVHEHADGTIHTHGWCGNHVHQRPLTLPSSKGTLLAAGLSGGLLPCPDALAILLIALAAGHVAAGMLIIGAFSLGLAATLVALSLLITQIRHLGRFTRPVRGNASVVRWLPAFSAAMMIAVGAVTLSHCISGLL